MSIDLAGRPAPARTGRSWSTVLATLLVASLVLVVAAYVALQFGWQCTDDSTVLYVLPTVGYALALAAAAAAVVTSIVGGRRDRLSFGGAIGGVLLGLVLVTVAVLFWTGSSGGQACFIEMPAVYVP